MRVLVGLGIALAVMAPVVSPALILAWMRCGSPPWSRRFWVC